MHLAGSGSRWLGWLRSPVNGEPVKRRRGPGRRAPKWAPVTGTASRRRLVGVKLERYTTATARHSSLALASTVTAATARPAVPSVPRRPAASAAAALGTGAGALLCYTTTAPWAVATGQCPAGGVASWVGWHGVRDLISPSPSPSNSQRFQTGRSRNLEQPKASRRRETSWKIVPT